MGLLGPIWARRGGFGGLLPAAAMRRDVRILLLGEGRHWGCGKMGGVAVTSAMLRLLFPLPAQPRWGRLL